MLTVALKNQSFDDAKLIALRDMYKQNLKSIAKHPLIRKFGDNSDQLLKIRKYYNAPNEPDAKRKVSKVEWLYVPAAQLNESIT